MTNHQIVALATFATLLWLADYACRHLERRQVDRQLEREQSEHLRELERRQRVREGGGHVSTVAPAGFTAKGPTVTATGVR